MLKGNDLILSLNGVKLASSKTCSIDRQVDTIEVCSPVDGPARRYIPTTTGWSIAASGLYANNAGAERLRSIWRKYQNGGVQPTIQVQVDTEGVREFGEAILTSLHEEGNLNELVKFSIQLQGSGKLGPVYRWTVLSEFRYMQYQETPTGNNLAILENTDEQEDYKIEGINITLGAKSRLRVQMENTPWPFVVLRGNIDDYRTIAQTVGATINNWVALGKDRDIDIILNPGDYCILTNWSDWADELPTITVE